MRFFGKTSIDFMGKRRLMYAVSATVIGMGMLSLFLKGVNYGIDFLGGTEIVVRFQSNVDVGDVRTAMDKSGFTKAEINIKNALRVALYQIQFLNRVPHAAAVNEAVEFIKRLRGQKVADLVNAVLRNIIRNIDNIRYPDPAEDRIRHLSVVESHPTWMTRRWVERYGFDEAKRLMAANNQIPDLSLRINRLKTELDRFTAILDQHQVEYTRSKYLPSFIRVKHMSGIGGSELFQQGQFAVQDESAGLAVMLLEPTPGDRILDLCAAPGGKTTFIGELLKNEGKIVAVDRYESRLNLVKSACTRLGVTNVEFLTADAATLDIPPGDKVLVDAPCSGLGTLSKKPDAKWMREPEDIAKLVVLQNGILEHAAQLVKPGGILVYSTCTIEPEENAVLIQDFLKRHPEFRLESAATIVSPELVTAEGYVQTFQHVHGMDGSFSARLRKQQD